MIGGHSMEQYHDFLDRRNSYPNDNAIVKPDTNIIQWS